MLSVVGKQRKKGDDCNSDPEHAPVVSSVMKEALQSIQTSSKTLSPSNILPLREESKVVGVVATAQFCMLSFLLIITCVEIKLNGGP